MSTNDFMPISCRVKDLTGKTFGRLNVLGPVRSEHGTIVWLCRCSCGTEKEFYGSNLKTGNVESCGCLALELKTKHGLHGTPEYNVWKGMTKRCTNPNEKNYVNYGGRGITVCTRWKDFSNFISDMGDRPYPKATIERIDNEKGYSPDNCCWTTYKVQNNNSRHNHLITFRGETHTMSEWADITGIPYYALRGRRSRGWCAERALTQPLQLHPKRK